MTLEELEATWASVSPPDSSDGIAGKRAVGLPHDRPVYLAIDGRGHRHLLIQVPDDSLDISQEETRSLRVATSRFQVGTNPESLFVDFACVDSSQHRTFGAVTQDLLRTLKITSGPVRDAVISALARWRAFWSSRSGGLSREDAVGLFGELWFMSRWLSPAASEIIDHWQATTGARHDFQWSAASIEVKTATTSSAGDPVHKVTNLDQLADPEHGILFLFSLQVREDALSANTLHALVENIATELAHDFERLTSFNEKLAVRGYTPADSEQATRRYRVLGERLYHVAEGFPRIVTSTFDPVGLPPGVVDVCYSLDLAACAPWLMATTPNDADVLRNIGL